MLGENDTMSRQTLREIMYELPEDLFEFEIEGVHLMEPDLDWLIVAPEADPAARGGKIDPGLEALDARPASAA
jgi:hypothetical protein